MSLKKFPLELKVYETKTVVFNLYNYILMLDNFSENCGLPRPISTILC